jgi:hypothetical protein
MIIFQLKDGYRYNSDTMFLYDFARENGIKGKVVDVGCGSGILGLLLKRDFRDISLSLLDILEINIAISKRNACANGLDAEFITADFANFKTDVRFDYVVSNPPFYHDGAKESLNEHLRAARYSRSLDLRDFIAGANSLLAPRGTLIFCYDAKRTAEILTVLKEFKLTPTRLKAVHPRRNKEAKLILIEAKKSSKSLMKISPPIFTFEGESYSTEAGKIFARADTKSEDFIS